MQSFSFHPEHGCLFPASDPCVVSVDFSLALLMLHSLASVTPQSIVGGSKWRKGTQNKQMKKTKMLTLFFWLRYYSLIWIGKMSQVMVQNQFRNSMLMAFPAPYLCSFVTAEFCSVLPMFVETWGSIGGGLSLDAVLLCSLSAKLEPCFGTAR